VQASVGIVSMLRAPQRGQAISERMIGDTIYLFRRPPRSMAAEDSGPWSGYRLKRRTMTGSPSPKELSIGVLARESGVKIETIRYYEKIGVMPKPPRSAGGYRLYTVEHLKRLAFVRRGRELGFGLDELRELLRLVDRHSYTCVQVRALMLRHAAEVRRKIADLRRLERVMGEISSRCSGEDVPDCPIVDALFETRPRLEQKVKRR
jgi:MerR family transcriptional regulator, mercuric resistance operon regulatory protein